MEVALCVYLEKRRRNRVGKTGHHNEEAKFPRETQNNEIKIEASGGVKVTHPRGLEARLRYVGSPLQERKPKWI